VIASVHRFISRQYEHYLRERNQTGTKVYPEAILHDWRRKVIHDGKHIGL
jgi:hypothetical protein